MNAGADVCVVSVHKIGTGFEQGSVFHRQGDLVDPDQLSACADMLMTTSPNVMVYAALDGWRRQLVQHGYHLLDAALTLAGQVRQDIDALPSRAQAFNRATVRSSRSAHPRGPRRAALMHAS